MGEAGRGATPRSRGLLSRQGRRLLLARGGAVRRWPAGRCARAGRVCQSDGQEQSVAHPGAAGQRRDRLGRGVPGERPRATAHVDRRLDSSLAGRRVPFNRQRLWPAAGAIGLGLVAAGLWWVGKFETLDATRAALVWLAAIVLAGLACSGLQPGAPRRPSLLSLAPLVLFGVALVPRLWQVADLPYGVWYDEANGALEIRRVFHRGNLYADPEYLRQGHLGLLLSDLGVVAVPR